MFIVGAIWVLDTLRVSFMCAVLLPGKTDITNYSAPASLEYIVWFACHPLSPFPLVRHGGSFPTSLLVNFLVITVVQFLSPATEMYPTLFYPAAFVSLCVLLYGSGELQSQGKSSRKKRLLSTFIVHATSGVGSLFTKQRQTKTYKVSGG
ncbi:hypothetical protein EDD16DRAFT_1525541 [Pisolithus croceorrhizus]|nr:hypothetical protein EV401DRAFT_1893959 [Pisolithus croceorrhizus]KAI6102572.1 hypothetical protein EDD16DRAFT_1525541 [Pisolithus croceorrhizus]